MFDSSGYTLNERPPRRRKRATIVALVMLVVLALVAGVVGLVRTGGLPFGQESFRKIGPGIEVNRDAPKNVRATEDLVADKPFPDFPSLGKVVHITPDGKLPHPVTLRFKLNRKVASKSEVMIATSASGRAGSWTLMAPTAISRDGRSVMVVTDHLSRWDPLLRDVKKLVNAALGELRKMANALTGGFSANVTKPRCRGAAEARNQGYTVKSAGDALYWCLGMKNGKPEVRAVNGRRYPLLLGHPNFKATYVPHVDFGAKGITRFVTHKGKVTLFPFDEAAFTPELKKGARKAAIGVNYDGQAQSLYQLEFGVTMLMNILNRFGAGVGTVSNGRIDISSFDRLAQVMGVLMQVKDCASLLLDPDGANPGSLIGACFDAEALDKAFGWRAMLLTPIMTAGAIVNYFRSEFNVLGDTFNRRDRHALVLEYDPMARYAGIWRVHGLSAFVINRDGTGYTRWSYGPCLLTLENTDMCEGYATLRFSVNPDGSLTGIYGPVTYKTDAGKPPPVGFNPMSDPRQGQKFTLRFKVRHVLVRSGIPLSNPHLCDAVAYSQNPDGVCGA